MLMADDSNFHAGRTQNGENIPVRCFSDYVEMFLQDEISSLDESTSDSVFYMHTKLSRDWEIALAPSTSGSFCQVRLVTSFSDAFL